MGSRCWRSGKSDPDEEVTLMITRSSIASYKDTFKNQVILSCNYKKIIICFCILLFSIFFSKPIFCAEETNPDKIYKEISGGRTLKTSKTSATFFDGKNEWTIFGAIQKKGSLHQKSLGWSVNNHPFEIDVITNPISNIAVLPYSDPLPNASKSNIIEIKACPSEHKSASFVIRAGNCPLENVVIKASNLQDSNREHHILSGVLNVGTNPVQI
jgi:hypothetical protein